jgi:hypothetical protein
MARHWRRIVAPSSQWLKGASQISVPCRRKGISSNAFRYSHKPITVAPTNTANPFLKKCVDAHEPRFGRTSWPGTTKLAPESRMRSSQPPADRPNHIPKTRRVPRVPNTTHALTTQRMVSSVVTLPAGPSSVRHMIAYALGARIVRGNSTSSRTPPLGAALPRHTGLRTRRQRSRQRIPGILHLAQRRCRRSAASDPQTLAAPGAGIAGNAFCSHSKKCEVSTNDTYAEGARDSRHAYRWLESVWITICPAAYLEPPKKRN